MNKKEIEELLDEKGIPCISLVIPMHRLATYREADEEKVNKAITDTKAKLIKGYAPSALLDKMLNYLDMLSFQVDYTHSLDGLGIYVSQRYSKLVHFPFPVTGKLVISDSFDSRDLLYLQENVMDYYIFSISKKYLRLFKCYGEEISEIKNNDFPLEYHEEFEYAKPSVGSSFTSNVLVGYEKDKSFLREERLKEFLRTADNNLAKYIKEDFPLVVAGDSKEVSDFMDITGYEKQVIGKVQGNYPVKKDLVSHAWQQVQNYIKNKNEVLSTDITELLGKHKAVAGIENVWKAVQEGKGMRLIMEKDFEQSGYLSEDKSTFIQKKNKNEHHEYIPEIVDILIKNVLDKKGSVTFVDNGSIQKFNGIALLLRYS